MKFIRFVLPLSFIAFISCSGNPSDVKSVKQAPTSEMAKDSMELTSHVAKLKEDTATIFEIGELEQRIIDAGLVSVPDTIANIRVDLKYATTDNFMQMVLYQGLKGAYLQPEVMNRLLKSASYLKEQHPELNLLIYDAVRPRGVQQMMWDSLKMPIGEKVKFVSNPKNGSLHNYGCALDITLCDTNGHPLDMGAGYDDVRKIAYPRYEKQYLDSGLLNSQHIENRNLLRQVMRKGGFWGIQTEWWHFNAMRRDSAKAKYNIVE